MSIHEGHRARLKRRFWEEGLDNFDEINVLELLLFYAIPQKDTNPIAHALIRRFGSLSGVLEAPVNALEQIPGVGKHAATLISLTTAISRYYMVSRATTASILTTVSQCGDYLVPRFFGLRDETVYLLSLDAKCKVISCELVGHGSVNSANVPIRKIVELALASNATSVVLAHNHPSGIAIPSAEDITTTKRLATALDAVGIILADHIVVADEDFVSMADTGLIPQSDFFRHSE
ncbi:MAG: DNA repair protein RadC [Oscillospiraceae bacterium]|nr:DNA repair protein RadC [Oscillospiraceae bacterium]